MQSDFINAALNPSDIEPSEMYMNRAIELAVKGLGYVNPNPLVGAVLVKNNEIIGEGWHHNYGNLHAEREAIKDCLEKGNTPEGADLYVTLEPCCHTGKQPPCTQAIIENKIAKVIVGSSDPNPLVAGKGISFLREHNVTVIENFMKEQCDKINEIFFHYITTKTPHITVKYAMTADGKTATSTGDSKWISCEKSRQMVHKLRSSRMAILTGINTVVQDDPLLTVRSVKGKNPVRVVLDTNLCIPLSCKLVETARETKTIIFYCNGNEQKIEQLKLHAVETIKIDEAKDSIHVDLNQVIKILGEKGIDSVLVEGGAHVIASFINEGLVNKLIVFVAPKVLGASGITGCEADLKLNMNKAKALALQNITRIDDDIMLEYKYQG